MGYYCDFIMGWFAGIAGLAVGHPIDTIKIRQQVGQVNMKDAAKNIYVARGWRGFFRGLTVPMLANGTLNAIFFTLFGVIVDALVEAREATAVETVTGEDDDKAKKTKKKLAVYKPRGTEVSHKMPLQRVQNENATLTDIFIGGSIAGCVMLSVSVPVELIKVKLQGNMANRRMFKNPVHVIKRVYQANGVLGFYQGIAPMASRNFIGGALNCYILKSCYDLYPESRPRYWYQVLPAAGFAGVVSWFAVVPLDNIKTRMQMDNLKRPRYKNMRDCTRQILKRQGVKGLYRGFFLLCLRQIPVHATTYLVYEMLHKYCKAHHGV